MGYDAMEKVTALVQVPTQTINNYTYPTITQNDTYDIPSGYTGLNGITVNVPTVNNYTLSTITQNDTYIIPSGYSGFNGFTVQVPTQRINNYIYPDITSNGIYTIPSGYTGLDDVVVNVPTSTLQSNKTYTVPGDGTSSSTYEITPTSGYDAMQKVTLTASRYSVGRSFGSAYSSSSYYTYTVPSYTLPSNDNSYTSSQELGRFTIKQQSTYCGFYTTYINGRIQYKTITENGTYYPYDNNTLLKKVVVNVPSNVVTITCFNILINSSQSVYYLSDFVKYSTNQNMSTASNYWAIELYEDTDSYIMKLHKFSNTNGYSLPANHYWMQKSYSSNVIEEIQFAGRKGYTSNYGYLSYGFPTLSAGTYHYYYTIDKSLITISNF